MDIEYTEEDQKPVDWPANQRERMLDVLCDYAEQFRLHPSYKIRETLLALINQHDLNDHTIRGLFRVTEYEVERINFLYMIGTACQINSLKTYLYDIITEVTRLQKILSCTVFTTSNGDTVSIEPYEKHLWLPLKLYHLAYQKFTVEKEKSFAEQIIEIVEAILSISRSSDEIHRLANSYTTMLLDLSHMNGRKRENLWKFTREELFELLKLEARLLKIDNQPANVRPTKGVLMMQISNFILKSRNGYNEDYICKYLPLDVARSSMINHQIWMKKTTLLNDEREQRVVPELFEDTTWINYNWAKNIDFTATRTYYVSSFSKALHANEMQKNYGECLYGYKNDRIAELIAPICMYELTKVPSAEAHDHLPDKIERPVISQVITFDVLYDVEEAKKELNYLFSILDLFTLTDDAKKQFLQEILQYWILSVKDRKWQAERERRYVLFLHDEYRYKEMECDDIFLKVKTSLFITPDFILGENPIRDRIKRALQAKRMALYSKQYLFCESCLMQDYDSGIYEQVEKCPICGSTNIRVVHRGDFFN